VSACVHICVWVGARACVCTCVCMFTSAAADKTCEMIRTFMFLCVIVSVCAYACAFVCAFVCVCARVCVRERERKCN